MERRLTMKYANKLILARDDEHCEKGTRKGWIYFKIWGRRGREVPTDKV